MGTIRSSPRYSVDPSPTPVVVHLLPSNKYMHICYALLILAVILVGVSCVESMKMYQKSLWSASAVCVVVALAFLYLNKSSIPVVPPNPSPPQPQDM